MKPPTILFSIRPIAARSITFGLRVTPAENRAIRTLARRLKMRPSDAVRLAVAHAIGAAYSNPEP